MPFPPTPIFTLAQINEFLEKVSKNHQNQALLICQVSHVIANITNDNYIRIVALNKHDWYQGNVGFFDWILKNVFLKILASVNMEDFVETVR